MLDTYFPGHRWSVAAIDRHVDAQRVHDRPPAGGRGHWPSERQRHRRALPHRAVGAPLPLLAWCEPESAPPADAGAPLGTCVPSNSLRWLDSRQWGVQPCTGRMSSGCTDVGSCTPMRIIATAGPMSMRSLPTCGRNRMSRNRITRPPCDGNQAPSPGARRTQVGSWWMHHGPSLAPCHLLASGRTHALPVALPLRSTDAGRSPTSHTQKRWQVPHT